MPPKIFMVIGTPSSGKTTMAAKADKPIFISTDGNAPAVGYDSIIVKNEEDFNEFTKMSSAEIKDYNTIVIDTLEGIVDLLDKRTYTFLESLGDKANTKSALAIPYGRGMPELKSRLNGLLDWLEGFGKTVILISYSKWAEAEDGKGLELTSTVQKSLLLEITKRVHVQIEQTRSGGEYKSAIVMRREGANGYYDAETESAYDKWLLSLGWLNSVKAKSTKKKVG